MRQTRNFTGKDGIDKLVDDSDAQCWIVVREMCDYGVICGRVFAPKILGELTGTLDMMDPLGSHNGRLPSDSTKCARISATTMVVGAGSYGAMASQPLHKVDARVACNFQATSSKRR